MSFYADLPREMKLVRKLAFEVLANFDIIFIKCHFLPHTDQTA